MRKSIYYAHSMKIYDTEQETKEREHLESLFQDVLCPNRDIKKMCGLVKADHNNIKSMKPFLDYIQVYPFMTIAGDYLGYIGKGVYEELMYSRKIGIPSLYLLGDSIKRIKTIEIVDPKDWKVKYARIIPV